MQVAVVGWQIALGPYIRVRLYSLAGDLFPSNIHTQSNPILPEVSLIALQYEHQTPLTGSYHARKYRPPPSQFPEHYDHPGKRRC